MSDFIAELRSIIENKEENHIGNMIFPILETDTHYEVMTRLKEVYNKTIHLICPIPKL